MQPPVLPHRRLCQVEWFHDALGATGTTNGHLGHCKYRVCLSQHGPHITTVFSFAQSKNIHAFKYEVLVVFSP